MQYCFYYCAPFDQILVQQKDLLLFMTDGSS